MIYLVLDQIDRLLYVQTSRLFATGPHYYLRRLLSVSPLCPWHGHDGNCSFLLSFKKQGKQRAVSPNKNEMTSTSQLFPENGPVLNTSTNCARFIPLCPKHTSVNFRLSDEALNEDCFPSWIFFRQCSRTTLCYSYQTCWRCFWRMGRSSPLHLTAVPLLGYVYTCLKKVWIETGLQGWQE